MKPRQSIDVISHTEESGLRLQPKDKRMVTRSVRLDMETDGQLVRKAEKDGVSLNTEMANALSGYVDWTQHQKAMRHTTVSLPLLEKMMDCLTLEEAKKLGNWYGENAFVELVSSLFGSVRLTSVLATLILMSRYSGLFDIEHIYESPKHHLRMHHATGKRWSEFYSQMLLAAFHRAGVKSSEVSTTESTLDLSVVEPRPFPIPVKVPIATKA